MKLAELFLTQEDQDKQAITKLKGLKNAIVDGDKPEIWNASSTVQGHSWNDLEKLGFAEKSYRYENPRDPDSGYAVWTYTGPNSIIVMTNHTDLDTGRKDVSRKEIHSGENNDPY